MKLAPIALFVYNRPWHTRQTIEHLLDARGASESEIYIFSDASRNEKDIVKVEEVRAYIKQIKGARAITLFEREVNFGLAKSIISGVTELVNEFGKIIVLEDDLVVSSSFLSYMNEALSRYQDHEKVMQVSGHMFPLKLNSDSDTVFLPFTTTWGWATWKKAWECFDEKMTGYDSIRSDKEARYRFEINGAYPYFKMLKDQKEGKIDSWGIRWHLSVFMKGGLTLYPIRSLVENIGFDGSGTHAEISNKKSQFKINELIEIKTFPTHVKVDEVCLNQISRFFLSQNDFLFRIKNRLVIWANSFSKKNV
jgi:hypothetical protein